MTKSALEISIDELNNLVVAGLVVAASFLAFRHSFGLKTIVFYMIVSFLVLGVREFGQRAVAQLMDAQVELELSPEGSVTSIFGAILATVTGLPIILLFPVTNSYDIEKYEQWGKDIDAMWAKREYWLASSGITALLLGWGISYSLGMSQIAAAFSMFTMFQLMPFDYSQIPTGKLDGATIIRWSGFVWLLFVTATGATFFLV